jgi:hypothetical protein
MKSDRAVDGIFGFGQHQLSVISQLYSLGVSPKTFSHCLKGSDNGGGILVLGEIVEPGLVFTPLVPQQPHYNLNLESIAVSGQKLPIDSSLFATSNTQGTIVDSGTTLVYLVDGAYDPFVNAIAAAVSPSVQSVVNKGSQCFVTSSRFFFLFLRRKLAAHDIQSVELLTDDFLFLYQCRFVISNSNTYFRGWCCDECEARELPSAAGLQ